MLDGNARQNLATFCQTWEEPAVHALMDLCDRQEHDRQGRVPADRRARAALRAHARRPVERPGRGRTPSAPRRIGSSEACMLGGMAAKWRWRARRRRPGKPTDRPNMVCGPVQVVWHKFAKYWDIEIREVPMAPGPLRDGRRRHAGAGRREHDRGRADASGVTYTGAYEPGAAAGRRARPSCRPTPGSTSTSTSTAASGALPRPVLRAGPGVGLPPAAGQVDQHVRPQVRARPARRRLGRVARCRRAARRPDLPRLLPRRRHAGVPDQLLPPGRPDRRAVLRLRAPRPRRLPAGAHGRRTTTGALPRRARSPSSGRSS